MLADLVRQQPPTALVFSHIRLNRISFLRGRSVPHVLDSYTCRRTSLTSHFAVYSQDVARGAGKIMDSCIKFGLVAGLLPPFSTFVLQHVTDAKKKNRTRCCVGKRQLHC